MGMICGDIKLLLRQIHSLFLVYFCHSFLLLGVGVGLGLVWLVLFDIHRTNTQSTYLLNLYTTKASLPDYYISYNTPYLNKGTLTSQVGNLFHINR